MDKDLYEEVARNYKQSRQDPDTKKKEREQKWKTIQQFKTSR